MQRIHRGFVTVLLLLALAGVLGACAQPDPPVVVTPFVAKAPQPPPTSQPAPAGLEPGTWTYEQAVLGK
jgi:hypothetical protein